MAKKKLLLNESVTRRFMKLAELKPTYVSNFLREAEEAEEEEMAEEEPVEEEMPEEEGMEEELPEEEGMEEEMPEEEMEGDDPEADAEALVMGLLDKVAEFAEENGVSMDIKGDEEEGEEGMEEEGMEEEPMEGEEEMGMEEEEMGMEEEGMEEELPEEEAEPMAANRGMYEARRALKRANVSMVNESDIINEVVKRVAKRLLKESRGKNKKVRRTRTTKRR